MADRGGRGRGGDRGRGDFRGRGRGDGGNFGGGMGRGGSEGGDRGRGDFRGRGRGDGSTFRGGRGRGGFEGGDRGRGGGGAFRGDRGGGSRGGRGGFESIKVFGNGVNVPQPNVEVTKLEDAMVKADLSKSMASASLGVELPARPAYGKLGRPIVLYTNYFELKGIDPNMEIYRYAVSFQPDDKMPKAKKRRLVELLLQTAPFAGLPIASDWAQILISPKKIPIGSDNASYNLEWYPQDGEPLPPATPNDTESMKANRRRSTFRASVSYLGTVSLKALLDDISQPTSTYPLKLETIQALNVMMAYGPGSDANIAIAGGNKFYPFGSHPQLQAANLGFGLQALRGYFTSVRTSVSRLLVNVNVATGAFYKPGPLLTLMQEFNGGQPPANGIQHRKVMAFVRLLKFETNYLPDRKNKGGTKRKQHIITTLSAFDQDSNKITFEKVDNTGKRTKTSIANHFKTEYNITLRFPKAPVVNYGTKDNPKWIPSELCTVLPGQLAKRLLLGPQTSEMIRFAARRPQENAESITNDGLQVAKIKTADGMNVALNKFGIKVNPQLLTVPGRILPAPELLYRAKTQRPNNGAWNLDPRQLGNMPFRRVAKSLGAWNTLIINSGNRDAIPGGLDAARAHLEAFRMALQTYGLNPGEVQRPAVLNISPEALNNKEFAVIQNAITNALKTQFQGKPNFLFVLLPGDNATLYDAIKFVCDCQLGIPNICNIGLKFSKEKGQMQYFANVAMKFNQKLGGVNHTVDAKQMSPLDAQTIVFGIDVTHPSPGSSETAPSIAGVVASVDAVFSQYPASMRTQEGRKEMVTELEEMIIERLRLWQTRNENRLPSKVIVYRDGVSEGQYRLVLENELPAFEKAFQKLYPAKKKPKISIVVVGKRHHTRFYPTRLEDTDGKTGNPMPGTVVDRGVTGEKLFDFFLLAHQGLQGTSKPAHYVVIKDDNKLGADQLQSLTHSLCYTFARATRAVSICPPAYYADLLCERGRSYLHSVLKGDGSTDFSKTTWRRDVNPALMETMYYL